MKALKPGWMMFGEYCRSRNITPNGAHLRKLDKLSTEHKENTTPNSQRAIWAVCVTEADKVFGK